MRIVEGDESDIYMLTSCIRVVWYFMFGFEAVDKE
jgi:hypothetical protein